MALLQAGAGRPDVAYDTWRAESVRRLADIVSDIVAAFANSPGDRRAGLMLGNAQRRHLVDACLRLIAEGEGAQRYEPATHLWWQEYQHSRHLAQVGDLLVRVARLVDAAQAERISDAGMALAGLSTLLVEWRTEYETLSQRLGKAPQAEAPPARAPALPRAAWSKRFQPTR